MDERTAKTVYAAGGQIEQLRAACTEALAWIEQMRPTKSRLRLADKLKKALENSGGIK